METATSSSKPLDLPAGDYSARVAFNLNSDNIIGAEGITGGDPVEFTVPEDNSLTTFNFDSQN